MINPLAFTKDALLAAGSSLGMESLSGNVLGAAAVGVAAPLLKELVILLVKFVAKKLQEKREKNEQKEQPQKNK